MRRSSCPSVVWKKKKLADGSALGLDPNGEAVVVDKINHLEMYKEKENLPVEEVVVDEYEGRRSRHEAKVVRKNFALNSASAVPICFAVHFVNLNRTAKKNLSGHGTYYLKPPTLPGSSLYGALTAAVFERPPKLIF